MLPNPTRPREPDRLLRRLEWTILRPLDGLFAGNYHTTFQGPGLDFAGLREYAYGDDVRTIDWNSTAKLQQAHVRRFHEDREIDAWFVVDTSPSLGFGSTGRLKSDVALDVVGALAALFARQGNRVGGCLYSGSLPRLHPASGGRDAALTLLRGMLEEDSDELKGETDLNVPLEALEGVLKRRSLIFVVSDFLGSPGWEKSLGLLTLRHEVLAVRVHDPGEAALPNLGTVWLQDSETGSQVLVDTGDKAFRRRLEEAARELEASFTRLFAKARVEALSVSTADDLVLALWGLARRRRLKKSKRGGSPS